MKQALLSSMHRLGAFKPFHWANRNNVLILMYHGFSRESRPGKISSHEFRSHLEYLKRRHCVLSLADVIDSLQNGKTLPANTTVLTIDDGYADSYDVAFPLLKDFQMPATVYAVTDFLDRKCWLWTDIMRYVITNTSQDKVSIQFGDQTFEAHLIDEQQRLEVAGRINSRLKRMPDDLKAEKIASIAESLDVRIPSKPTGEFVPISWEQAREMDAANVRIESHTVTHPILTNVEAKDVDRELIDSKKRLEEMLERRIEHFCYPNGSLNTDIAKAAKAAGYLSATTTNYGFNTVTTDRFLLKRIDAHGPIANFAQSVSGFEAFRSGSLNS